MEAKKEKISNKILVPYGATTQIMNVFGISAPTVREALRGNSNSDLAKKIRHTALERFGGVELDTKIIKIKKLV